MASANANILDVYYTVSNFSKLSYAEYGFGAWESRYNEIYSGTGHYAGSSNPYYVWRSKIAINIPGSIANTANTANITGIVLKMKTTQTSYPIRSCAGLSSSDIPIDNIAKVGSVYISNTAEKVGDISAKNSYITTAMATNSSGVRFTNAVSSGTTLYYRLNTKSCNLSVDKKGKTMYIYLFRVGDSKYISGGNSGWVASKLDNISVTIEYETTKSVTVNGYVNSNNSSITDVPSKYGTVQYKVDGGTALPLRNFGQTIDVPYGSKFELIIISDPKWADSEANRGGYIYVDKVLNKGVIIDKVTSDTTIKLDIRTVKAVTLNIENSNVIGFIGHSGKKYHMLTPFGISKTFNFLGVNTESGYKFTKWVSDGTEVSGPIGRFTSAITSDMVFKPYCEQIGYSVKYSDNKYEIRQTIHSGESFNVGHYAGWPKVHLSSNTTGHYIHQWKINNTNYDIGHQLTLNVSNDIEAEQVTLPCKYYIYVDGDPGFCKVLNYESEELFNITPTTPPGASLYGWYFDDGVGTLTWDKIIECSQDIVDWENFNEESWKTAGSPLPGQTNRVVLHPIFVSSCLPIVYRNGEPRMLAVKVWKNDQWYDCYMHCLPPKTN